MSRPPADLQTPHRSRRFRVTIAFGLAVGIAMLIAQIGGLAQAPPPDALPYTRSFLLTGNYVVGGVDMISKNAQRGFINSSITISGVPVDADIVAATLYWETVWTTRSQLNGVKFRGEALTDIDTVSGVNKIAGVRETDVQGLNSTTQACLGSGQKGLAIHVSEFAADVLRLLPQRNDADGNWTGLRLANGNHSVSLPDRGTGDGAAISSGATLVLVYRAANEPLRKIVLYEGGYAQASGATTTQTIRGFLNSSAGAQVTVIGGTNQSNATDRLRFYNERESITTLLTDPLKSVGASDRGWSNPTATIARASNGMPGLDNYPYGEEVRLTLDHTNTSVYDCQTLAGFVFSAATADVDADGIPDRLEDATSELRTPPVPGKPNGYPYPRLDLMGASSAHKDLFLEINAMRTDGQQTYGSAAAPYNSFATPTPLISVTLPQHSHMPDRDALKRVGDAYASHGITPHFDVGNTTQYLGASKDCGTANADPVCQYLVPNTKNGFALVRGGETFLETKCDPAEPTCQFPDYPGTIGWPFGYELFRDAPVDDVGGELTTPEQIQAWTNGTGVSTTYRVRFDLVRRDLFHYVLFAHARGNPRSLPCIEDGFPAPYDADANTCSRPGVTSNPSFRSIDYHVPTSSSGVADQPGGNVLITLGLWDKVNGTGEPFLQASTMFHEVGHNLGLGHGGALPIPGDASKSTVYEANCKPNYQSSMSYLFQVHGLIDKDFAQQINYSEIALSPIVEKSGVNGPVDGKLWAANTPVAILNKLYQPTWFAPADSTVALAVGATSFDAEHHLLGAATRLCNGFRLGAPPDGELATQPTPAMARVWAKNRSASNNWDVSFDWNGDGSIGTSAPANVNFDGEFQGGPSFGTLTGFNDWSALRLNQITAGKNLVLNEVGKIWEGAGSLWQGGGALWQGGGALWQGGGALWQGGGSLWQGGGSLWQGGGSLWQGGGSLWQGGGAIWEGGGSLWQGGGQGGELDFESAKGLGRTPPTSFKACVLGGGCTGSWQDNDGTVNAAQPTQYAPRYHKVYTSWTTPSVGTVAKYQVFRAQVAANPVFAPICDSPNHPACPDGTKTTFVDQDELPNNVSFEYYVRAFFSDDTQNQVSPESNHATVTGANVRPIAVADAFATNEDVASPLWNVLLNDIPANAGDADSALLGTDGRGPVVINGPQYGTLQFFADGTFRYTPNPNFNGVDSFTYKILGGTFAGTPSPIPMSGNPGLNESDPTLVTITVRPVNDAPSAAAQAVALNEDSVLPIALSGTDVETGAANLQYIVTGAPSHGTLSGTGQHLTYTPAANYNGADSFAFTVTDRGDPDNCSPGAPPAQGCDAVRLTSAPATVSIVVHPVNDAPSATPQAVETPEDPATALAITLAGTDVETSNPANLTYAIVTGPTHGTLSAIAGQGLSYMPAHDFNGTDSFTFTVTDRGDPDNCAALPSPPQGCDSGTLTSAAATVAITVLPVNDAPTAAPQSAETTEDTTTPLPIVLSGADLETVNAADLTYVITGGPSHGTLSGTGQNLTYKPAANYNGSDSFTFTVTDRGDPDNCAALPPYAQGCDSHALTSAPATISIVIHPVNDPPAATPQSVATNEDVPLPITLSGADAETASANLTYEVVGGPELGTLVQTGTGPNFVYTPYAQVAGEDSFTFRVTDRGDPDNCGAVVAGTCTTALTSAAATVIVTITPTGDAKFVVTKIVDDGARTLRRAIDDANANAGTPEAPFTNQINFKIPGDGVHTITPLSPLPAVTGLIVIDATTQQGYSGMPLVELAGGAAGTNPLTVHGLTLKGKSHQVRGLAIFGFAGNGIYVDQTGLAPTTITGNIIGLRADGTTAAANGNGIAHVNSGSTIGGPAPGDRNIIGGNSDSAISFSNSGGGLPTLIQGNYIGTDVSGLLARRNHVGVSIGSSPSVQVLGNLISANDLGIYIYNSGHRLIDGLYNSVVQGNTIGLNAAGATLPNGVGITLNNADNLIGGTSSGQGNVIAGNLAQGVAIGSDATVTGNRVLGNRIYNNGGLGIDLMPGGVPGIGVTSNDAGDGDSGPNNLQNFPVLNLAYARLGVTTVAGSLNSAASTTFRIEVFKNAACDPSGNGEGETLAGTTTVTTNTSGDASFRFALGVFAEIGSFLTATATDANGNTSEFSPCTLVVPNRPPTTEALNPSTNEDVDLPIALAGGDPDGDPITFAIVDGPTSGTLSGSAPNLIYHPAANFNGGDSFTFYASDGELNSVVRTVDITVVAVNDDPSGQNDSATTRLNAPITVAVLANDSDVDLDTLSVTGVTAAAHGLASIDGGGTSVTYQPSVDFAGSDTFDYTVSDGHGGTATAHVSVTVRHVGAGADMTTPRRVHSSTQTFLADGTSPAILIAGGRGPCATACSAVTLKTAELYDPATGLFSGPIDLNAARQEHVAVRLHDGRVLVAGGWSDYAVSGGAELDSAEIYNFATGMFGVAASMHFTHASGAAVLLNDGRVLVTGGYGTGSDQAEIYDPASDTWQTVGPMHVQRFGHTATLLPGGRVLVVGGFNSAAIASAEIFDPAAGTFATIENVAEARYLHTATALADGRVVIAGGFNSATGVLASVEIYDPTDGHFYAAPAMTTTRDQHTATLLGDGTILFAGGGPSTAATDTLEVYDPATSTATRVDGGMTIERSAHAASLLPDGKVLITGGFSNTVQFVKTTDVFKP